MSVLGFDIGNDASVIAQAKRGGIDVVLNENSNRRNPTLVSFQGKQRFLGEAASAVATSNYKNTIKCVKRLIGRMYDEPEVQDEIEDLPFKTVKLPDGKVGFEVTYSDEPKVCSCETIYAAYLSKLAHIAAQANPGASVRDVVVSVPGWYTEHQRRAVLDASAIANLRCLKAMNEHTAVALAYGIYKSARNMFHETEPQYVMFIDLGQSSYTVAIVAYVKGKLEVKSAAFDRTLGSRSFDKVIAKHVASQFKEKYNLDPLTNSKSTIKLMNAASKAKHVMSPHGVTEAAINVEFLMQETDYNGKLKTADFEEMCSELIGRLEPPIAKVLADTGLKADQLSNVEIVGGGSRVQAVKRKLGQILGLDATKTNYGLGTTLNADEAVARGCALQCAILSPLFRVKDFAIADVVPYPIRLSWEQTGTTDAMDTEGGDGEDATATDGENSILILNRNDETPKIRRVTFRRVERFEVNASYDEEAKDLLPEGTIMSLGKFAINVNAAGGDEVPKIRVNVKHDIHGCFDVSSANLMREIKEEPKPPTPPAADAPAAAAPDATEAPAAPEGEGGDAESAETAPAGDAPAAAPEAASEEKASSDASADKQSQPDGSQSSEPTESPDVKMEDAKPAASEDKQTEQAPAEPAAEGDAVAEKPKEEKPKKKRFKKLELQVESETSSMAKVDLDLLTEDEVKMAQQDRIIRETEDKRNELESYIYSSRDSLDTQLKDFMAEQDRESFRKQLTEAEDWLYSDEGFDSTKSVYAQKLADLQAVPAAAHTRKKETEGRPSATKDLLDKLETLKKAANSTDEMYAHIADEKKETVRATCQDAEKWLYDQLAIQNDLKPDQDPVLTCAMIVQKKQDVHNVCNPILTEPKPAPPPVVEEKKQDEGKEAEGKEAESKDGQGESKDAENASGEATDAAAAAASEDANAGKAAESQPASGEKMDLDLD